VLEGGKFAKNFSGLAIFQLASEARLSGGENALTEEFALYQANSPGLYFRGIYELPGPGGRAGRE